MAGDMNEIMYILMNRDGMTEQEAITRIEETMDSVFEARDTGGNPEEVFEDMLDLDIYYLYCLL